MADESVVWLRVGGGERPITWHPDRDVGYYLKEMSLYPLGPGGTVLDLTNRKAGRLAMSYIPEPGAVLAVYPLP